MHIVLPTYEVSGGGGESVLRIQIVPDPLPITASQPPSAITHARSRCACPSARVAGSEAIDALIGIDVNATIENSDRTRIVVMFPFREFRDSLHHLVAEPTKT
jgi:hypothetical protein